MNVHEFSVAMLITNENIKTPTVIAKEAGKSQSSGSRLLTGLSVTSLNFVQAVKEFFGNKAINFATDDSCISRRYSQNTEAVSSMKDQLTKTFTTGTSVLIGGFTDGTYFIPVDLEQWVTEFIMKETYLNHIRCVFWAYTILQFIMKKIRLDSAEDALRKVQALKNRLSFNQIVDSISLMMTHA